MLSSFLSGAQPKKRELRAAWIATVGNIDWPSKKGLSSDEQKTEFIARIDQLKKLGCNAVIVQIRPASDAVYASQIEPWSAYLTGTQGKAPEPYYDPLTFMIEEVHKRNMEFHAWFNPFRALVDSKQKNSVAPNHVVKKHPEWIIHYGGKGYIDPGYWQARDYVISVICDVVKRYDIDGVHLDDYFYPYKVPGKPFGDNKSYQLFGQEEDKEEWRRNNVNLFIEQLNKKVKDIKPYVKFGVSPFGVWRNIGKDPNGSRTTAGTTCFDDLYSDVVLWMKNGWVDYLMPQLYWEHGHKAASFSSLLPWWNNQTYGRHMYYGLGVYRMWESASNSWRSGDELLWQIRDIRLACNNAGCCFYSASSFNRVTPKVLDSLQQTYNRYPAIPPAMRWLDSIAPAAPQLSIDSIVPGITLQWKVTNPKKETLRFLVYRFEAGETVDLERADRILAITANHSFTDNASAKPGKYKYAVTALDRLWNESRSSNTVERVIR